MQREGTFAELSLPAGLSRLLETGGWPSSNGPSMVNQQLKPLVSSARVRRFAAEETLICLQTPPFPTVAQERAQRGSGDFWERFGALNQLVPEKALIIGDFGLGSDAPIILDYAQDSFNPPVLRLRWGPDGRNEWVQGAKDFDEFAQVLGLTGG